MSEQSQNGTIELSTGVVLRTRDVPVAALGMIKTQMYAQRPKEPEVWLEDKDRIEANPNDPDYIAAVDDWEERLSTRLLEASIMLGTEIESLPEGFPKPETKDWAKMLEKLGIDIPNDAQERYLAWVKYRAAPTAKDVGDILLATSRQAGVTEEDAAEAAASFRGNEKR